MNESRDPFDVLRDSDPVGPNELQGVSESDAARATLERIVGTPRESTAKWRPRWVPDVVHSLGSRRLILVGSAGIAVAIIAVVVASLGENGSSRLTVRCYAGADLASPSVVLSSPKATPTSACGDLWRRRSIGASTSAGQLAACRLPSGEIAVFRFGGGRICGRLGLLPYHAPSGG